SGAGRTLARAPRAATPRRSVPPSRGRPGPGAPVPPGPAAPGRLRAGPGTWFLLGDGPSILSARHGAAPAGTTLRIRWTGCRPPRRSPPDGARPARDRRRYRGRDRGRGARRGRRDPRGPGAGVPARHAPARRDRLEPRDRADHSAG